MVRNIGSIEGNRPATDNGWEAVKRGGDAAIRRWIADQMKNRSCTVVLAGASTANRKWINHEIVKSWDDGMGVVGICIHGLKGCALETDHILVDSYVAAQRHDILGGGDFAAIGVRQHGPS